MNSKYKQILNIDKFKFLNVLNINSELIMNINNTIYIKVIEIQKFRNIINK